MNIFAVSADPVQCAQALDNRRLVKMVLETAQMLSTTLSRDDPGNPVFYKSTHASHPCTRWVMADPAHLSWTIRLFFAYTAEYRRRYDRIHASDVRLGQTFRNHLKPTPDPEFWCNCTPYTDRPVFEAYRLTLTDKWRQDGLNARPPRWTATNPPDWYVETVP